MHLSARGNIILFRQQRRISIPECLLSALLIASQRSVVRLTDLSQFCVIGVNHCRVCRFIVAHSLCVARIPIPCCGHGDLEFKLTRLLAFCGASRLVLASFVLIRESIADLGCASGEKLDSVISVCSIILSEYTRTLGTRWHC